MTSDQKHQLTSDCGPHCGIDGFSSTTRSGHCPGCHDRTCEASRYDRSEVKKNG